MSAARRKNPGVPHAVLNTERALKSLTDGPNILAAHALRDEMPRLRLVCESLPAGRVLIASVRAVLDAQAAVTRGGDPDGAALADLAGLGALAADLTLRAMTGGDYMPRVKFQKKTGREKGVIDG